MPRRILSSRRTDLLDQFWTDPHISPILLLGASRAEPGWLAVPTCGKQS
jgi:hypothetical protein